MSCENIANCGFFKKYQESKNLVCKGFMLQFCNGTKEAECERKKYKAAHGTPPSDDMMPNGSMIHE
ncbi:MAG: hypothetical protein PHW63_06105 [Alphaproteobacteria bacterium]|nr:hypothetical protein [Alphaproteobacteria bacterium]